MKTSIALLAISVLAVAGMSTSPKGLRSAANDNKHDVQDQRILPGKSECVKACKAKCAADSSAPPNCHGQCVKNDCTRPTPQPSKSPSKSPSESPVKPTLKPTPQVTTGNSETVGTNKTLSPTPGPPLTWVGVEGCTIDNPCPACSGDCDISTDCLSGLECFKRTDSSNVPGCASGGVGDIPGADYCYTPSPQEP